MQNKIRKALFIAGFALVGCLSLVPGKDEFGKVDAPKKYLLDGNRISSDSQFSYYLLQGSDSEVAIGKGDSFSAGILSIPETVTLNGTEYSVTGIWNRGFANCGIHTLTIPTSITVIDYEAFYGNSLKSLNIPNSVTKMGSAAFALNPDLTNVSFSNSSASGDREACPIEDTQLEDNKASAQSEETSSGPSLTEIPDYCFDRCTSLKYISFPTSLKTIKYGAFQRCSSITSLYLPQGRTKVESKAFNFCQNLLSVYIPGSLTDLDAEGNPKGVIEPYAFTFCKWARVIQYADSSADIQNWEKKNGTDYKKKTDVDNYFYGIGDNATPVYDLGEISVSGEWQYREYTYTSPSGWTKSGIQLVRYLGNRIKLDGKVKYRPDNYNQTVYDRYAVGRPSKIGDQDVISIASDCLDNLRTSENQLTDLYLPKSLYEIPNEFLGSFITSYNKYQKFPNLFIISTADDTCFRADDYDYNNNDECKGYIDLSGIENLNKIGDDAFYTTNSCLYKKVTSIKLPGRLEYIGEYAFEGRDWVTDFKIDNDVLFPNQLKIRQHAFGWIGDNTNSRFEVTLPSRTSEIGANAFEYTNISYFTILNLETEKERNPDKDFSKVNECDLTIGRRVFYSDGTLKYKYNVPTGIYIYNRGIKQKGTATSGDTYYTVTRRNDTFDVASLNEYSENHNGYREIFLPGMNDKKLIINNYDYNNCPSLLSGNGLATMYFSGQKSSSLTGDWNRISKEQSGTAQLGYNFGYSDASLRTYYDRRFPYYENVDISQRNTDAVTPKAGKKILKHKDNVSYLLDTDNKTAIITRFLFNAGTGKISGKTYGNVILPDKLTYSGEDYTITEIGNNAFACSDGGSDTNALNSLIIPDTITKIGSYAFFKCPGLKQVSTKANTGSGTSLVEHFTMPSSLKNIGVYAFAFSGITKIDDLNDACVIDNSDDSSIPSPFYNCPSLSSITLKSSGTSNPTLSVDSTTKVLKDTASNTILFVPSFSPYNSTDSRAGTFTADTKFHFGALQCATWITNLTIYPNSYSTDSNGNIRPQALFNGYSISSIRSNFCFGKNASDNSSSVLKSVVIKGGEDNELLVPTGAFKNCNNLNEITIPKGKTGQALPASIFANAKNVKFFKVEGDPNTGLVEGKLDLTNTNYGSISSSAFQNRNGITSVILPDCMTTIGDSAFENCSNLKSLTCGSGLKTIGDSAFRKAGLTGELFLNQGLETIGGSAFEQCKSITKVTIPSSVTTLSKNSFYRDSRFPASALTDLSFENGSKLTSIPEKCFGYISAKSVNIPRSVTVIGPDAFSYSSLESVDRPGVITIGNRAFSHTSLKTLSLPDTVSSLGTNSFEYIDIQTLDISNLANLSDFKGFNNCDSLTSVTLPTSITTISSNALSACPNLKKININELINLKSIGSYAFNGSFSGSDSITLTIPKSVTNIDSNAFSGTGSSLKAIVFTGKNFALQYGTFSDSRIERIIFKETDSQDFTNNGFWGGCFANRKYLKTLVLPSNFDITSSTSLFSGSNTNINVCLNISSSGGKTFGSWIRIDATNSVSAYYNTNWSYAGDDDVTITGPSTSQSILDYGYIGIKELLEKIRSFKV